MRIIGGTHRGRTLLPVPAALPVRPTSDRVRGALFNVLQHRFDLPLPDTTVLDICCGSGALGLEALSRGARQAWFIDSHPQVLALAKQNAKNLSLDAACRFWKGEVRMLKALPVNEPAGLVLADPPYAMPIDDIAAGMRECPAVRPDSLVVLETGKSIKNLEKYIEILHKKEYGATIITFGLIAAEPSSQE